MRVFVVALLAIPGFGQLRDLFTTSSGDSVLFVSESRQSGSEQLLTPKIFAAGPDGVRLVKQIAREGGPGFSNHYRLYQPVASEGLRRIAWSALRECAGGSSCFLNEQSVGTLHREDGSESFHGGRAVISRNGRYLFEHSSVSPILYRAARVDLQTGARVDLSSGVSRAGRSRAMVASNGFVLLTGHPLQVWTPAGAISITSEPYRAAAMDESGATVIYETAEPRRLFVVRWNEQRRWQLGPGDRESFGASISDDGGRVAYLTRLGDVAQVIVSGVDGANWKQVTAEPEGIAEVALSGDGTTLWAATMRGGLLKIDVATGASTEVIAAPPRITRHLGSLTPGSYNVIEGLDLKGADPVAVLMDRREMHLLSASPGRIEFQVPWELEVPGSDPVRALDAVLSVRGGAGVFEAARAVSLANVAPRAFPLTAEDGFSLPLIAIHEDWSGLVTGDNPARPGEIIHLYVSGLGPVEPPVRTGERAGVLHPVTLPFRWVYTDVGTHPLEVLYAGLAPGLTGVYQIDARMPAGFTGPLLSIGIYLDSAAWSLGPLPVR
ncbi:MAG: hypothetical protein K2X35_04985 [Bryobacteraceae bacterium]|nr:hypothetical protein [Bryobacteraceae bacterium]